MGRFLLAAAAFAVLASGNAAVAEVTAEIVDWGIVSGHREPPPEAMRPGESGLAPSRPMHDIRYEQRTDTIEARLCRNFGITVRLSADDGVLPPTIEVRVAHPTFTRPDGATSTEDRFPSALIGSGSFAGFTFDHEWEMVPGAWSIAIFAEGHEIARRSFTITSPAPGSPRSECQPGTIS